MSPGSASTKHRTHRAKAEESGTARDEHALIGPVQWLGHGGAKSLTSGCQTAHACGSL